MAFFRSSLFCLLMVQAGIASMVTSELSAQAGAVPEELAKALPERSLPELETLLKTTLENGPSVLIRRWEAEQSRQNARAARAPMLPYVYGSVNGGVIFEQTVRDTGEDPDRVVAAALYNFGVSQPVFHWGALSKGYEVGKLYQAISARNVEETRRLLAIDLRRRYFDLVLARGAVRLEQKNIAELEAELDLAKKRVAEGFAASTESGLIEGKLNLARISLQRLTNDYDLLRRNFARLTGLPAGRLPEPVSELPAVPELDKIIKELSGEAGSTPSIRLLNSQDVVKAERLNYEINKTRLKPKLGLSFSVGQDNRNADNDQLKQKVLLTSWSAFATVNWTLFDGFSASAAQRAALARMRAEEANRGQIEQQDSDERRADVAKLQYAWRLLQEAEKSFSGAKSAVTSLEKDVVAGWAPRSTVDEAKRSLDLALQSTNASRAEFYTVLATYFSNRGIDPALRSGAE
jgi:outer membrane protein, multidrug efflux system